MSLGNTVRLDFYGTFEMLDFVQVVSDQISRMVGLDEDARHWVGVAVRESVINAIKHGNAHDERKRVHVEFTPLDGSDPQPGVVIRVRDEGPGFDPATLPDPLAPENLLKASGRGIFLIRNFMDQMDLRRAPEGGMEVVMVKRVSSGQDAASASPGSDLPGHRC
jgi:serine/threonine-protein kinase RsbW